MFFTDSCYRRCTSRVTVIPLQSLRRLRDIFFNSINEITQFVPHISSNFGFQALMKLRGKLLHVFPFPFPDWMITTCLAEYSLEFGSQSFLRTLQSVFNLSQWWFLSHLRTTHFEKLPSSVQDHGAVQGRVIQSDNDVSNVPFLLFLTGRPKWQVDLL